MKGSREAYKYILAALLSIYGAIAGWATMYVGYLYRLNINVYAYLNWVLGVLIILLNCATIIYVFAGYAVLSGKKDLQKYRGVIIIAVLVQLASIVMIMISTMDPLVVASFLSAMTTTIAIFIVTRSLPAQ